MMKGYLIFISLAVVSSLDLESFKSCRLKCKEYLENEFHSNVCNAARNIFPIPSVYRACMKGKMVGFEHACMSSCTGDSNLNEKQSSLETCQSFSKKPIPNHQFPWCRRGYDNTFTKVKENIIDILPTLTIENKSTRVLQPESGKEDSTGINDSKEKDDAMVEIHVDGSIDVDHSETSDESIYNTPTNDWFTNEIVEGSYNTTEESVNDIRSSKNMIDINTLNDQHSDNSMSTNKNNFDQASERPQNDSSLKVDNYPGIVKSEMAQGDKISSLESEHDLDEKSGIEEINIYHNVVSSDTRQNLEQKYVSSSGSFDHDLIRNSLDKHEDTSTAKNSTEETIELDTHEFREF